MNRSGTIFSPAVFAAMFVLVFSLLASVQSLTPLPAVAALSKKEAKQLMKDFNAYKNNCKNYDPSKSQSNKTCKNLRNSLTSKAGCNLGNKKVSNKQLNNCKKKIEQSANQASSAIGSNQDPVNIAGPLGGVGVKDTGKAMTTIVNIVFSLAGGLALLFTVIGGTRFILSRGDPQGTAQARSTIIYALVGLIVTILAFAIVKFVMSVLF